LDWYGGPAGKSQHWTGTVGLRSLYENTSKLQPLITVTLRNSTVELTYGRTENEIYRKIMIDER